MYLPSSTIRPRARSMRTADTSSSSTRRRTATRQHVRAARPASCSRCATRARHSAAWTPLPSHVHACNSPLAGESLELWDEDRSELICRGTPIFGGGSDKVHDERGFIVSIPPCLWGSADDGLRPPPRIHLRSNLLSISRANSTRGVTGYMALWQMRAAFLPPHQQHQRHHIERRSDRRARTEAPPPE